VGQKIEVLCTKIDHVQGSIKLSRKKLLRKQKYLGVSHEESSDQQESYEVDNLLASGDSDYFDSRFNRSDGGGEEDVMFDGDLESDEESDSDHDEQDSDTDLDSDEDGNSDDTELDSNTVWDSGEEDGSNNAELISRLESLTVLQLREIMRRYGLRVRGRKDDLITRACGISDQVNLFPNHADLDSDEEGNSVDTELDSNTVWDSGEEVDSNKAELISRLESLTVPQLQEIMRRNGLRVKGIKADLITRAYGISDQVNLFPNHDISPNNVDNIYIK
jgi:hypothetical protein